MSSRTRKEKFGIILNGSANVIRVDYNVPIENGIITDDTRIVGALETINYCLEHNCRVILLSHLGRVKEEADLTKNNLAPVAKRLSELLDKRMSKGLYGSS